MKNNAGVGLTSGAAMGVAIGAGMGAAVGVALRNISLWLPIGAALGVCFGSILNLRPRKDRQNPGRNRC
jgi:hypothetical protein